MAETFTKLEMPPNNPNNVEAKKYYIFNETGNIMMASTNEMSMEIQQSVRDVFAEVSVFFAAMTRAISTTIDPKTNEPYSMYNYTALERIIAGSGLFVHVTQSDLEHRTKSVGATFSKELLEGLLGLATGAGALSFAQGMLASVGKEGMRIGMDTADTDSKVCNIVFVCEYLLGMPSISAIVVYANVHDNKAAFEFGPCIKIDTQEHTWKMHKDTYLFVTPKFVREYSGDLASIASNTAFNEFVEYLRAILKADPRVSDVMTAGGVAAPTLLTPGVTYSIMGVNLNETESVKLGEAEVLETGTVDFATVKFTVKPDAPSNTPVAPIALFNEDDKIIARTAGFGIAGPTIATQPQNVTVNNNTPATLTVTAAGGTAPYAYQWYEGESPVTTKKASGASAVTASFTTPNLKVETKYWVQVKDANQHRVNSTTAVVTVNP